MSSSTYGQRENDNNERFDQLASKLSTFKKITQDIQEQSIQDNFNIDNINETMSNFYDRVKNSSGRLTRVMSLNSNMTRMIVIGLLSFAIIWTLLKFW